VNDGRRRTLKALAIGAASFSDLGCRHCGGSEEPQVERQRVTGVASGVRYALDLELSLDRGALSIDLEVQAPEASEIAVMNRIDSRGLDDRSFADPDQCHVVLRDQAIHIEKVDDWTPFSNRHARPPTVTRVPRGAILRDSFSLDLPLEVCDPAGMSRLQLDFARAHRSASCTIEPTKLSHASKVVVAMAWAPVQRDWLIERPTPDYPNVCRVWEGLEHAAFERLVGTAVFSSKIPILDYDVHAHGAGR
jgi:hypothetical protein